MTAQVADPLQRREQMAIALRKDKRLLGGWLDLGGLALMLLLLNWVEEGYRGVDLGCAFLEELVILMVDLGDDLSGSRSAPPVACGGLLTDRVLHE